MPKRRNMVVLHFRQQRSAGTMSDYGQTALRAAAGSGHESVVETLLKAGADVNALAGYPNRRTALQPAAGSGHEASVETLLEAGADVNDMAAICDGRTALQAAAERGHQAVVKKLLTAGADVNAPGAKHSTRIRDKIEVFNRGRTPPPCWGALLKVCHPNSKGSL